MKTTQPMNYRHQTFTIWTSKSFRNGALELRAEDFKQAFNQLSESDKCNLICICNERGEQRDAREFK
jgi:hypothetical protein